MKKKTGAGLPGVLQGGAARHPPGPRAAALGGAHLPADEAGRGGKCTVNTKFFWVLRVYFKGIFSGFFLVYL